MAELLYTQTKTVSVVGSEYYITLNVERTGYSAANNTSELTFRLIFKTGDNLRFTRLSGTSTADLSRGYNSALSLSTVSKSFTYKNLEPNQSSNITALVWSSFQHTGNQSRDAYFNVIVHRPYGTFYNTSTGETYEESGRLGFPSTNYANYNTFSVPEVPRQVLILTAPNFNDEENPTITYNNVHGDNLDSLEAGISIDGLIANIYYKPVDTGSNSYTFDLSEEDREYLRKQTVNSNTRSIWYMLKTVVDGAIYYDKVERTLSIVNANPVVTPNIYDTDANTIALTGNEKVLIRYHSDARAAINTYTQKHATFTEYYMKNGATQVSAPAHTFENVESDLFIFYARDSRGNETTKVLEPNMYNYVHLTCNLGDNLPDTDGNYVFDIKGQYYNGTFGAADNTLLVEYRMRADDSSFGDWTAISHTLNGNSYTATTTITGLDYRTHYVVQVRATDKLEVATTPETQIFSKPVFSWSDKDFEFNCDVNVNGEFTVNGAPISGGGGGGDLSNYYTKEEVDALIPEEVDLTDYYTKEETDALIPEVDLDNYYTKAEVDARIPETPATAPADYIIATGTEAMGTNGTWYWTKWFSGKAECYGQRNFGIMDVNSGVNYNYFSAEQVQKLPTGLFSAAPDFININFCANGDNNNSRLWIANSKTAANPYITGGFQIASAGPKRSSSSTQLKATPISFHVIGKWRSSLPTGYTPVNYIESTGTQYINTGFTPNQDTRVVMDIEATASHESASKTVFGSRIGILKTDFSLWFISNTNLQTGYGNATEVFDVDTVLKRLIIDKNKTLTAVGDYSATNAEATFQSTLPLFLLAMNQNGTADSRMAIAKLYSCQIYDNGKLVRDFAPCVNPSGKAGLYDTVNGVFYENAGSGTFITG